MKKTIQLILLIVLSSMCFASEGQNDPTIEAIHSEQKILNNMCPVLPDMKVNPEIFTDYQGKRIHFCCDNCKATFEKNSEKYLDRLPQFASESEPEHSGHEHSEASSFPYFKLVKPMGIVTLILIILTVSAGLLRRKQPKLLFKWHKRLGILTLMTALIHALLVLLTH